MKKMLLIAGIMLFLASCTSDREKDSLIGLSETELNFDGVGDTVKVLTEVSGWNLSNICVDGVDFKISDSDFQIGEFGWLSVWRSDRELTVGVKNNYGAARSFSIELELDGEISVLSGSQEEFLDGIWEDIINLSPRDVAVPEEGGVIRATTDGYWWIVSIIVNENYYPSSEEENRRCADENYFDKQVEWLRVQRDGNDVVVTVDANTTGELRTFMIRIGQGDFYTLLNGVQAD